MLSFILWYLAISLLGWLTLPIAFRLLPGLPDRGYTLARALGWLLWGYLFWMLGSLHILQNDLGGLLFALVLLVAAALWALRGGAAAGLRDWLRANHGLIFSAEAVFLVAFAAWTFVRAADPAILYTEKPMEIAFINSILQSPGFPPQDPWLSGYAISYYYFGYVLVAMLARVTAVAPEIAFNLALALLFGLTALGAYGLVYNLLKARRGAQTNRGGLLGLPLLGPLFLLLVSNLEGLLESLHARGLFWSETAAGWQSSFWTWLDVKDLTAAPIQPFTWVPNRPAGWLWWRASRVVSDYKVDGSFIEIIDEFPFFSYLLGDLHPHVLVMPFALLAIGVILNFYLDRRRPGFSVFGIWVPMDRSSLLLAMLVMGGLSFLNTWDFPIYVALFAGAYVLVRAREAGWSWNRLGDFIGLGVVVGVGGAVLYLPFYLGFASQARGILPSLVYFTRGAHFWVMFAPLLLPVAAFLIFLTRRSKGTFNWKRGFLIASGLMFGLWLLSYLFGALITLIPAASGLFLSNQAGNMPANLPDLLREATLRRLQAPGTWLTLLALIALAVGLLVRRKDPPPAPTSVAEYAAGDSTAQPWHLADGFVLLLALLGALLTVFPEFFYLWDLFGNRMNTIFKFYFQAWVVWSIAAAYATAVLFSETRRLTGLAIRLGWAVLTLAALVYPAFMLWDRTNGFSPQRGFSLDGLQVLDTTIGQDEIAAIHWLRQAPYGIIAEAWGGGYDMVGDGQWVVTGRAARYSGLPAVLGWTNHEGQWGRDPAVISERQADIEALYRTTSWEEARQILDKYQVRYVIVGQSEQTLYRVNTSKFVSHLAPVFQSGALTIYEVPGRESALVAEAGIGYGVGNDQLP